MNFVIAVPNAFDVIFLRSSHVLFLSKNNEISVLPPHLLPCLQELVMGRLDGAKCVGALRAKLRVFALWCSGTGSAAHNARTFLHVLFLRAARVPGDRKVRKQDEPWSVLTLSIDTLYALEQ